MLLISRPRAARDLHGEITAKSIYLNYFVLYLSRSFVLNAFWKSFSYITAQSCFNYTAPTPTYNHKLSESVFCSSFHMLKYHNNNECPRAIFMSHSRWVCLISDNITLQIPSCQTNVLELCGIWIISDNPNPFFRDQVHTKGWYGADREGSTFTSGLWEFCGCTGRPGTVCPGQTRVRPDQA